VTHQPPQRRNRDTSARQPRSPPWIPLTLVHGGMRPEMLIHNMALVETRAKGRSGGPVMDRISSGAGPGLIGTPVGEFPLRMPRSPLYRLTAYAAWAGDGRPGRPNVARRTGCRRETQRFRESPGTRSSSDERSSTAYPSRRLRAGIWRSARAFAQVIARGTRHTTRDPIEEIPVPAHHNRRPVHGRLRDS